MKPFDEWTYQDAVDEIAARKKIRPTVEGYVANQAMVEEHDFWQDGDTWVGPRGTSEAWAAALKASIELQHIPGAASTEALSNFVRGLFGREANIQAVPLKPVAKGSEEEKRLNEEGEELISLLSVWWDRVSLWAKLRKASARSRWATWGTLRLWIPSGRLNMRDDGTFQLPSLPTFEGALAAVELSAPEPDHCIVLTHPDTQQQAAIFHFVDDTDQVSESAARVELWYEDGEKTALIILRKSGAPEGPVTYDWNGQLPVAEVEGELMLTEVVRRQEAGLSFQETNVVKVGETAGFRERYTMNAEPNGLWLTTAPTGDGPHRTTTTESGQTIYFHPVPRSMGPAVATDLIGVKIEAGTGATEKRATPGVHIADPVDPDFATKGADYRRRRVLQLCSQGHLAMIGTGEASGTAYEQARAAFRGDLEWHKSPAESAIVQIFTALIRMGESMSRSGVGWLDRFRLVVTLTVDPGPVSPEYREQIMMEVEKGLRSRPSAMGILGIEDVAGELEAIEQDPEAQLGLLMKRVEVMVALMAASPGLSLVAAAVAAGWDEAEAKKLFSEADAAAVQERQARDEIADALARGRAKPEPEGAAA